MNSEDRQGWYKKAMDLVDAYNTSQWSECNNLCNQCLERNANTFFVSSGKNNVESTHVRI